MARTFGFACRFGDLTLSWDAKDDPTMLPIIDEMLRNKYRFHILRKHGKRVEVSKISQAQDARKIVIPNDTLQQAYAAGILALGGLLVGDETTGEIATTAQEVAENDTLVQPPIAGG